MHGLHLRLPQEKNHISEHCNAKWPCLGEILLSSFGAFALEDNFYWSFWLSILFDACCAVAICLDQCLMMHMLHASWIFSRCREREGVFTCTSTLLVHVCENIICDVRQHVMGYWCRTVSWWKENAWSHDGDWRCAFNCSTRFPFQWYMQLSFPPPSQHL